MIDENEAEQMLAEVVTAVDSGIEPSRSAMIGLLTGLGWGLESPIAMPDAKCPGAYAYGVRVGQAYAAISLMAMQEAGIEEIQKFVNATDERRAERLRDDLHVVKDDAP